MGTKDKFFTPNYLNQQFMVSQRNKRWCIDDTMITIGKTNQKLRVLHIIDLATKCVLNTLVTTKDFNAAHIKRAVINLLGQHDVKEFDDPAKRLIIHTDRDTHFSSKTWVALEKEYPKTLRLSMSPKGTPIENAVSERFNRTIKEIQVPELFNQYGYYSLKEVLANIEPGNNNTKFFKKLVKLVADYYNTQHMHSDISIQPALAETIHITYEPTVAEPQVIAARNNNSSPIEDRVSIAEYKNTIYNQYNLAQSLINTEGLSEHEKFLLEIIKNTMQQESRKLAALNQAQFVTTNTQLVEINEKLEQLNQKIKRKKRNHNAIALRDPVVFDIYKALIDYFPKGGSPNQMVHFAQMKCVCVTLYVTGARVNEIRGLTYEDFKNVFETGNLAIKQTKTNEFRTVYLGDNGASEFEKIRNELTYLFEKLQFKYLGCSLKDKNNVMNSRSWIRKVNSFLKEVKEERGIHLQLKSHSFRIGFINSVLRRSDIAQAAALVGHKSLETTKRYLRYQNSTKESRAFLDDALGLSNDENSILTKDDRN